MEGYCKLNAVVCVCVREGVCVCVQADSGVSNDNLLVC